MFCTKCGKQNDDNAFRCIGCGNIIQQIPNQQFQNQTAPQKLIPTNLALAIVTTLFCCMPIGIIAIVYAAQVKGKLAMGDYSGAQAYSKKARMWCWIAFLPFFIYIVFGSIYIFYEQMKKLGYF